MGFPSMGLGLGVKPACDPIDSSAGPCQAKACCGSWVSFQECTHHLRRLKLSIPKLKRLVLHRQVLIGSQQLEVEKTEVEAEVTLEYEVLTVQFQWLLAP